MVKQFLLSFDIIQSFVQIIFLKMNRPIALMCYICGREFGTHSLAIHIKACEKKWENAENLKPPKERRPCPRAPKGFEELTSKGGITKTDINKFNAKSFDAFVEEALVECEYCGRRFNQKSLIPHQKACKTNPMIRKPYVNKGPLGKNSQPEQPIAAKSQGYNMKMPEEAFSAGNNNNLTPCRRCGRTFNPDRIGKHERVCKGDRLEVKAHQNQMKIEQKPSKLKPNFGKEKKPKWKQQHEEFQNAIKAMRDMKSYQAKGGKLSDLPPPPRSNYDHYVECRYCGRKYAPDVAERHIPKCANIINKPGGIKPSKIQQKYIGGTGSGSNKPSYPSYPIAPSKPNLVTPGKTSTPSYSKHPTNTASYEPPSAPKYNNGPSAKTNPFQKPSMSSSNTKTPVKPGPPASNYLKPNLNGRSQGNGYW